MRQGQGFGALYMRNSNQIQKLRQDSRMAKRELDLGIHFGPLLYS